MNNLAMRKRRLQSELKALSKYTYKGKVLAKQLGLSHSEALDELLNMRQWLSEGEGKFLEDRLLMLCRLRPGEVKMSKVVTEVTPLINTMLFKSRKAMTHQIKSRTKLLRTIPILTVVLLYGVLRASGRLREGTKPSLKVSRSPMFIYEKMDRELKANLGSLRVLFQGKVNADLQKVLFIGTNASPIEQDDEDAAKGFPPVVIWLLKRYMENKENEYYI